jgi:hypothetical protein
MSDNSKGKYTKEKQKKYTLGQLSNEIFEKYSYTHAALVNSEPEWMKGASHGHADHVNK